MRSTNGALFALLFAALPVCLAQEWEIGAAAGYGVHRDVTVTAPAGSGKAGFKPGLAVGAIAGHNMYDRLGGEIRYTYRFSDLRASGGGQENVFDGETHVINYDLLYHFADNGEPIRPFVAGGGGMKLFRGLGTEHASQPAEDFALPTKTQQIQGLISAGAGVKVAVSDHWNVRFEFRDYITRFPKEVVAPAAGAKMGNWLHDFVGMVGITYSFE
jgi:hypothetical protein